MSSLELERHVDTLLPTPDEESRLLSDALDTLDRCVFVGLTEEYDESMCRLGRLLGWPRHVPPHRLNEGADRLRAIDLDAATLDELKARVRLDQALYDVARSRFHAASHPRSAGHAPGHRRAPRGWRRFDTRSRQSTHTM
jgi:hypothetical protein